MDNPTSSQPPGPPARAEVVLAGMETADVPTSGSEVFLARLPAFWPKSEEKARAQASTIF